MHENRETSGAPRSNQDRGRPEKAQSRNAGMHASEGSDHAIVPVNRRTTKGNLPRRLGREGRGPRRTSFDLTRSRHSAGVRVSHGLRDAGADVVMKERPGSHGDAFWQEEFPLMVAWAPTTTQPKIVPNPNRECTMSLPKKNVSWRSSRPHFRLVGVAAISVLSGEGGKGHRQRSSRIEVF